MSKDFLDEANLVDLNDDELKELLGHTYHGLKNLDEQQKNDPEIERMKAALKTYVDDNFADRKKALKARLKAARALAAVRGVEWKLPRGE